MIVGEFLVVFGLGLLSGACWQAWWCSSKGHGWTKCAACSGTGKMAPAPPGSEVTGRFSNDMILYFQGVCLGCRGRGEVR